MIQYADMIILEPYIVIAATAVAAMLTIAFYRNHGLTALITLMGLAVALVLTCLIFYIPVLQRQITPLIIIDRYALFFLGLILAAGIAVTLLSYAYLEARAGNREEFYLLILFATLGTAVLAASTHFASLFLGIEILSVSLYALTAYLRHSDRSIEAGVKYLILAAVSSAFILFGMALVYAETGSMEFSHIAARTATVGALGLPVIAGFGMIIVGLGFKLAVVPFHMWTPDVYEGAPAPVTAFIATVSKGAVFALVLRSLSRVDLIAHRSLFVMLAIIAVASMFAGNLLALLQNNIKRILAYSSISHLGYLVVALLAGGSMAVPAAAFYLVSYFITTLGAFGVVIALSRGDRDAESMEDYAGLAWRRPCLAGIFTAMLLSLAGIPLTAGFVGKFYIVAAGVGSGLWIPVLALVVNSVIGLFYYLRIIIAVYAKPETEPVPAPALSLSGGTALVCMTIFLVWLGVYPGPLLELIRQAVQSLA